MNNHTICAYPWFAAAIKPDGTAVPCCAYKEDNLINKSNSNVLTIEFRKNWNQLRKNQLDGISSNGCNKCYEKEIQQIPSLRQYSFNKFPVPTSESFEDLKFLEISLSNLCNLACLHCSSYFSTKWQTEDIKHKRNESKGIVKINENIVDDLELKNLEYLKLIGGEPFLEQEKIKSLLGKINLENCSIQICTNGTTFPDEELQKQLTKAKVVLIAFSMDGIEQLNDWYRWPSKWNHIEKIIEAYERFANGKRNIFLHFHCCVNVYNVFYLKKIVDYVLYQRPSWKIQWDWVENPKWQSVSVLPEKIKTLLINELSNCANISDEQTLSRLCDVNPFSASIEKIKIVSDVDWNVCVEKTQQFAAERKFKIDDVLPRFFYNL